MQGEKQKLKKLRKELETAKAELTELMITANKIMQLAGSGWCRIEEILKKLDSR